MAKIDTQFMTKTGGKTIPFVAAHTYIAHIREYPPPDPVYICQSRLHSVNEFITSKFAISFQYNSADVQSKAHINKHHPM